MTMGRYLKEYSFYHLFILWDRPDRSGLSLYDTEAVLFKSDAPGICHMVPAGFTDIYPTGSLCILQYKYQFYSVSASSD